ncbi:MAG: cytochrome b [Alcanivoracaceae bacterium]|nr:cytochrome b [Alcanivoracaceae bacterium]
MTSWSLSIRTLHWLVLALVVLAWASVEAHEQFPRGSAWRGLWMQVHFHAGMAVLMLTGIRLFVRLAGRSPEPEDNLMARGARIFQWLFYPLLVALPVAGFLTAQFDGKDIALLNVLGVPALFAPSEVRADQLEDIHGDVLFALLTLLVVVHAGAALIHHFVLRDDTLRRMWRR